MLAVGSGHGQGDARHETCRAGQLAAQVEATPPAHKSLGPTQAAVRRKPLQGIEPRETHGSHGHFEKTIGAADVEGWRSGGVVVDE